VSADRTCQLMSAVVVHGSMAVRSTRLLSSAHCFRWMRTRLSQLLVLPAARLHAQQKSRLCSQKPLNDLALATQTLRH